MSLGALAASELTSGGLSLESVTLNKDANSLQGKVIVLTGGAMGIGQGYALHAAKLGAKLAIGDLNEKELAATLDAIKAAGGQAIGQLCDVTSFEQQATLFARAVEEFGPIDIVVPSAGVTELKRFCLGARKLPDGSLEAPSLKTLEINLIGTLYTLSLAIHHLKANPAPGKAIALMGSIAGLYPLPRAVLYGSSKHALAGAAKCMMAEAQLYNISLAYIAPFFTDTHIIDNTRPLLAGVELCSVDEVVDVLVYATTNAQAHGQALVVMPKSTVSVPLDSPKPGHILALQSRFDSGIRLEKTVRDFFKVIGPVKATVLLGLPVAGLALIARRVFS